MSIRRTYPMGSALLAILLSAGSTSAQDLELRFLNVGQGHAILVRSAGWDAIIDTGHKELGTLLRTAHIPHTDVLKPAPPEQRDTVLVPRVSDRGSLWRVDHRAESRLQREKGVRGRRVNESTESDEDPLEEEGQDAWTWIVDFVSSRVVRVEQDNTILHVPHWLFPASVREGDVLRVSRSSSGPDALELRVTVDTKATEEIRRDMEGRIQGLQSTAPGGDLEP